MKHWVKGLVFGAATGLMGAILGLSPIGTDFEQNVGLDWLFNIRGPIPPPGNAAVIAINKNAADSLGLPPLPRDWPRSIHARLIENLIERGASVIVFDMDFQRPKDGIDDREFGKAIADSGKVVLFERLDGMRQPVFNINGQQTGTIWTEQLVPPIPVLNESAIAIAPFPLPKVQVNVYQFWAFKPSVGDAATIPAAALQVLALSVYDRWVEMLKRAVAPGIDKIPPRRVEVRNAADLSQLMISLRHAFRSDPLLEERMEEAVEHEQINDREAGLIKALIRLYAGEDNHYLNFYGPPGSIPNIPYNAVITGEAPGLDPLALDLTGKVVFVGYSDLYDPGQPDRFYTVFTRNDGVDLSGVEIAATAFANMLTNRTLRPAGMTSTAVILMLTGLILGSGIYLLSATIAVPLALLLSALYIAGVQYAFNSADLWLPLATPILVQLPVALFVGLLAQYVAEARNRRHLKAVFGRYVPPEIVDEMSRHPDQEFSVEGESRELSVLFCDIRSFTTISESLPADELKKLLNHFFTPMTRIIFEKRGTIDKYVGDMIMAFWGAPVHDPGHCQHAVEAALAMLNELQGMRDEFREHNWPEVNIGIGINTGLMNVGDMGSEYRRAYTVIGDAVNLGSRLEGLTKYYGVRLIISESTAEGLEEIVLRRLDRVRVKGKNKPVFIYEAVGKQGSVPDELVNEVSGSNQALDYYFSGDWQKARSAFQRLRDTVPERKLYALYLDRIDELQSKNRTEGWDGVFEHTSK